MLRRRKRWLRHSDGRLSLCFARISVIDPNGHFTTATFIQDFSNKGFLGGAQLGCQQQTGTFLWGAEADWSSFNNANNHTFSSGFDEGGGVTFSQTFKQSLSYTSLWSVRRRFGVILSDVYHLYATAGVGGATAKYTSTAAIGETAGGACTCRSIDSAITISPTGFVIGAGAEWKIWSNVVVGRSISTTCSTPTGSYPWRRTH
jgi:opacity protein-like surface antigen